MSTDSRHRIQFSAPGGDEVITEPGPGPSWYGTKTAPGDLIYIAHQLDVLARSP